MIRGNNKKRIFHCEDDFGYFIYLVKDNKRKYSLEIYHYVLMSNHVHMIIKSPTGKNLSDAMKRLNVTYTRYYRKKYEGIGHFFQDRFKSFLIQNGKYLLECGRYIELNPVRAGVVKKPEDYKWGSYMAYVEGKKDGVTDIDPEYEGLSEDKDKRKEIYRQYIEEGRKEKRNEERFFREGAYGSKEFIAALKNAGLKTVWSHGGRPKKEI